MRQLQTHEIPLSPSPLPKLNVRRIFPWFAFLSLALLPCRAEGWLRFGVEPPRDISTSVPFDQSKELIR